MVLLCLALMVFTHSHALTTHNKMAMFSVYFQVFFNYTFKMNESEALRAEAEKIKNDIRVSELIQ